jgi:hypothetical protein
MPLEKVCELKVRILELLKEYCVTATELTETAKDIFALVGLP